MPFPADTSTSKTNMPIDGVIRPKVIADAGKGRHVVQQIPRLSVSQQDAELLRADSNDAGISADSFTARALIDALYLTPGYEHHFAVGDKLPRDSKEAYQNMKFRKSNYAVNRPDIWGTGDYIEDKDLIKQFSNLETGWKGTFFEPLGRELVKQTGAVAAGIATTAATYPFVAPVIVAQPWTALPILTTIGLGSYMGGYTASDAALDALLGEDPVAVPSQSWKRAGAQTLGSLPFMAIPYTIPKNVNLMGANVLRNLYKKVELAKPTTATGSMSNYYELMELYNIKPLTKDIWGTVAEGKLNTTGGLGGGPVGLRINRAMENFLGGIGSSYKNHPYFMGTSELIALGGGTLGSGGSEKLFPGEPVVNVGAEVLGSLGAESTVTRLMPTIIKLGKSGIQKGKSIFKDAHNIEGRQMNAVRRIFQILIAEGEDVQNIIKALESNEIKTLIEEAEKNARASGNLAQAEELAEFKPTVVNLVESPALSGIFHSINQKSAKNLNKFQEDAQSAALDGVRSLVTAMKLSGDAELYKIAVREEALLMHDLMLTDLRTQVADTIAAFKKVRGDGPKHNEELSKELNKVFVNWMEHTKEIENRLYNQVKNEEFSENFNFFTLNGKDEKVSSILDGKPVPNFLRVWKSLADDAQAGTLADFNKFGSSVSQDMGAWLKHYFPDEMAETVVDGKVVSLPANLKKIIAQYDTLNTTANNDVFNYILRSVNKNAKPGKKAAEALKKELQINKKFFLESRNQFTKSADKEIANIITAIKTQKELGVKTELVKYPSESVYEDVLKFLTADAMLANKVDPDAKMFIQYFVDLPPGTQKKIVQVDLKDKVAVHNLVSEILLGYKDIKKSSSMPTSDELEPLAEIARLKAKQMELGKGVDSTLPNLPPVYAGFVPSNTTVNNYLDKISPDASELEKAELVSFLIDEHIQMRGKVIAPLHKKRLLETKKLADTKVKKLKEEAAFKKASGKGKVNADGGTTGPSKLLTTDALKQIRTTIHNAKKEADAAPNGATATGWLSLLNKAILDDYASIQGGNANFDTARSFTFVKNELISRSIIGDLTALDRKGAPKHPTSTWIKKILAGGSDIVALRMNQISRIGHMYKTENEALKLKDKKGKDWTYSAAELLEEGELEKFNEIDLSTKGTLDQIARNILYSKFGTKNLDSILAKLKAGEFKPTDVLPLPKSLSEADIQEWKAANSGVLELLTNFGDDLDNAATANNLLTQIIDEGSKFNEGLKANKVLTSLLDMESVHHSIGAAFRSSNPTEDFEGIFNLLKNVKEERIIKALTDKGYNANAIEAIKNSPEGLKGYLNKGLKNAVLEWAQQGAASSYSADAMSKVLFEPIPNMHKPSAALMIAAQPQFTLPGSMTGMGSDFLLDSARVRQLGGPVLMDILIKQGVVKADEAKRLRTLLDKQSALERAAATNTLTKELIEETGEFATVALAMLGSTAARKIQEAVFGTGSGGANIIIAGAGARAAKRVFDKIPKTFQLDVMTELMEDPVLFSTLLRKVANESQAQAAGNAVERILMNAGIIPLRPTPWITREIFEDKGAGPVEQSEDEVSFVQPSLIKPEPLPLPPAPQGPPPEMISPSLASASPITPIAAPNVNQNQNQRTQLAAAFPFDITSDVTRMKKAGIGSLMG